MRLMPLAQWHRSWFVIRRSRVQSAPRVFFASGHTVERKDCWVVCLSVYLWIGGLCWRWLIFCWRWLIYCWRWLNVISLAASFSFCWQTRQDKACWLQATACRRTFTALSAHRLGAIQVLVPAITSSAALSIEEDAGNGQSVMTVFSVMTDSES